jgi:endoglycosylceramidase
VRALFFLLVAMNGRFVDEKGGTVLLRGVNVAGDSKVPPFRPITHPTLLDPLPAWGMNAVRLLFTWEAYEPTRGAYDASYLSYYKGVVSAAWARGLFVIVDFHQDAFSRFSLDGCGEGFPEWAIAPDVPRATPDNSAACADWGSRMLGRADLDRTWDAFYADEFGARTRYLTMVTSVAQALADEPGVIGYDLLNEPGGDEATQLLPLYEDAARAVRAVHPSAILFVSPGALTSAGFDTKLPRPSFDNFAYAPHYYDTTLNLLKSWGGYDPDEVILRMTQKAVEWGVPLLVGEFGAPAGADGGLDYIHAFYASLDKRFLSGTQWVYTPGWTEERKDGWNAENFSVSPSIGNFPLRIFPRRVAGVPTELSHERKGGEDFRRVSWIHDPAAGETEIIAFVVQPQGLAISTEGDLKCRRLDDPERPYKMVRCQSPTAGAKTVQLETYTAECGLCGVEVLPLLYLATRRWKRKRSSAASSA